MSYPARGTTQRETATPFMGVRSRLWGARGAAPLARFRARYPDGTLLRPSARSTVFVGITGKATAAMRRRDDVCNATVIEEAPA